MEVTHVFLALFALTVGFGVLAQLLNNPSATNGALMSGADTISGVTLALEGRPAS